MTEEKRGPGRPKKEVEKTWDEMSEAEQILHTYNDGGFDAAVCAAIQVSKEEFDDRIKTDEDFKRIISFGRTLCQARWESAYNEARKGGVFKSATMINFAMKNMFGWAEKSETTNSDLLSIEGMSRDEVEQKLRDLGPNVFELINRKNA